MNCNEIHKIIERIASCNATSADEQALASHVKDCQECRQIYEAAIVTARTLALVTEVEPPMGLCDDIMRRVSDEAKASQPKEKARPQAVPSNVIPFPGIMKYASMAIAAAVVALLIMPMFRGDQTTLPITSSNNDKAVKTDAPVTVAKNTSAVTAPAVTDWECSADDVTGAPMIKVGDETRRLVPGDKLVAGVNIKTDASSAVKLRYRDNTLVNVKPGSEVVIKINSLMLRQGATWLQVTKKGSRFEVTTPTAIAGVLGTRFGVFQSPDGKACVSVFQGKVSVTGTRDLLGQPIPSSMARSVLLEAGRKVVYSPSTGMSQVFGTTESEEELWKTAQALNSAIAEEATEASADEASVQTAPDYATELNGQVSGDRPEDKNLDVHYNTMQGLDNDATEE